MALAKTLATDVAAALGIPLRRKPGARRDPRNLLLDRFTGNFVQHRSWWRCCGRSATCSTVSSSLVVIVSALAVKMPGAVMAILAIVATVDHLF